MAYTPLAVLDERLATVDALLLRFTDLSPEKRAELTELKRLIQLERELRPSNAQAASKIETLIRWRDRGAKGPLVVQGG